MTIPYAKYTVYLLIYFFTDSNTGTNKAIDVTGLNENSQKRLS